MALAINGSKLCSRCREDKPVSEFWKRSSARDGLRHECKTCGGAEYGRWLAANPDRNRELSREWSARNPEKHRAAARRWHYANRERVLVRLRARASQPEAKEKQRQWVAENREKVRERNRAWAKANRHKRREIEQRRTARRRGVIVGPVDLEAVREQADNVCYLCWVEIPEHQLSFDHVVPLARGGTHEMSNIRVVHARCNSWKKDRLLAECYGS